MIKISEDIIKEAGSKGMDEFLQAILDAYLAAIDGHLTAENMHLLNGEQHTLLAYHIFREEINQGGFVQLIQNNYGGYIFENPFAKAMRLFGAKDFSKLIYRAKDIYDFNREELERETTEEEFTAMYVDFEQFDELEEQFFVMEEQVTNILAQYVNDNIERFVEVV